MSAQAALPSAISFNETSLTIIDRNGQPWLASGDLARALGYADASSVNRIYARRQDEFTNDMQGSVKLTGPGGQQEQRIFSPRGAHLIAMFARTERAAAFRRWVLDVLEGIAKPPAQPALPSPTLTPAQQRHIQRRVSELSPSYSGGFAGVYRAIKDAFNVGTYKDIPANEYGRLCVFLGCEPLTGEWQPAEPATPEGHVLTDDQMYVVWFVCTHFRHLDEIYHRHNLYTHLTGLGSRAGIEMLDHFKDGMVGGVNRLERELGEAMTQARTVMEERTRFYREQYQRESAQRRAHNQYAL